MARITFYKSLLIGSGILSLAALGGMAQGKKVTEKPADVDVSGKVRNVKPEVKEVYKKWLDNDVAYIITSEEKKAFKALQTDEERENFIENFWRRRDPNPDTEENEYR